MKSELDVLVVGGYGIADKFDGGTQTRDRLRLTYKDNVVSLGLIKHLVEAEGDLEEAEKRYFSDPMLRQFPRQLNTIYLWDFLDRHGFSTEAISYYLFERQVFEQYMASRPKVLALSTTFISEPAEAIEIARAAKQISPETVVIAGGINVLKSIKQLELRSKGELWAHEVENNSFLCNPREEAVIDAFVLDECGELTLLDIVRAVKEHRDFHTLPNLGYWRDDGERETVWEPEDEVRRGGVRIRKWRNYTMIMTERKPEPFSFERFPIRWEKVPPQLVGNEIPVRAGVGCPFKCAFCDFAGLHERTSLRRIDDVIEELKRIQAVYSHRPIFFTDDNLFISKRRTRHLCEAIIDAGLKFPWRAFFRVDAVDDEIAALAAKAGCTMAMLGVESGDPQILRNMKKQTTPEMAVECVTTLTRHHINSMSFFVVGFPGETVETVNSTIALLNSYPESIREYVSYYPFVFCLTPLCRASRRDQRREYGLEGMWFEWRHATMDAAAASEELVRIMREVKVPLLQYPELWANGLARATTIRLMRARQELVQSGTTVLTAENAKKIYPIFRDILNQPADQAEASAQSKCA